jgi:hypothetical protein
MTGTKGVWTFLQSWCKFGQNTPSKAELKQYSLRVSLQTQGAVVVVIVW